MGIAHRAIQSWIWRLAFSCVCLAWLDTAAAQLVAGAPSVPLRGGAQMSGSLPRVTVGGVVALDAGWVFWGPSWQWANTAVKSAATGAGVDAAASPAQSFEGQVDLLDVALQGRVQQQGAQALTWNWQLKPAAAKVGVIGGGLSFRLALPAFRHLLGEPELLPGGAGWAWGRPESGRMEMRFDPPPRSVEFERGQANEVRAYFYKGQVPATPLEIKATLTVSGPEAQVALAAAKPRTNADFATWPNLSGRLPDGPLDLRYLNEADKPAGRLGRITARGERLYFGDGREARLWGTNITAYALFQTHPSDVAREARRLARMGYNLVRLHHHDSNWVDPNIFGVQRRFETREINERMARQIDWWIKCLADEGIYVWLDLHAGRHLRSQDGITAYEEIARGANSADLKGYNYVNPSIQAAMGRFAEDYLTRKSSETGRSPIEETAVAFVLLTNENDLTHHYGNALLGDKNVPWHHAQFKQEAEAFARKFGLPASQVMQTWLPGPSKLFLNDVEYRVHAAAIERLRKLGLKALVASTNFWGDNPQFSLPALTVGDVVDIHAYSPDSQLSVNPNYGPTLFDTLAMGTVVGRPTVVTEWNIDAPAAADRHALPLMIAARAAQQGISALMHYAHTQSAPLGLYSASQWEAYSDPVFHELMPLAALLYRTGQVNEATARFVYAPSPAELFDRPLSPGTAAALRLAARAGRLQFEVPVTPQLAWTRQAARAEGGRRMSNEGVWQAGEALTGRRSLDGQLAYDWDQGLFQIDTDQAWVQSGSLRGALQGRRGLDIQASEPQNATVAVLSLDGKAIDRSSRVAVALVGHAVPQADGRLPYRQEPLQARVRWRGQERLIKTGTTVMTSPP